MSVFFTLTFKKIYAPESKLYILLDKINKLFVPKYSTRINPVRDKKNCKSYNLNLVAFYYRCYTNKYLLLTEGYIRNLYDILRSKTSCVFGG